MTELSIGDVMSKDNVVLGRRSIGCWFKCFLAISLTALFAPVLFAQTSITSLNFERVGSGRQ